MWLIEHEKWGQEEEMVYVRDIVDTYENLVHYFKVLSQENPHLEKKYDILPRGSALRETVVVLEGDTEMYSIIRIIPTNVPTVNV